MSPEPQLLPLSSSSSSSSSELDVNSLRNADEIKAAFKQLTVEEVK